MRKAFWCAVIAFAGCVDNEKVPADAADDANRSSDASASSCALGGDFQVSAYSGPEITNTLISCAEQPVEMPPFVCGFTGDPAIVFRSGGCGAGPNHAIIRFLESTENGPLLMLALEVSDSGELLSAAAGFAFAGEVPTTEFDSGMIAIDGAVGPDTVNDGCIRGTVTLVKGSESAAGSFVTLDCL